MITAISIIIGAPLALVSGFCVWAIVGLRMDTATAQANIREIVQGW